MADKTERLVVELEAKVDAFNRDLRATEQNHTRAVDRINGRLDKYQKTSRSAGRSSMAFAKSLGGVAASIGAVAAASQLLISSIQISRDFEQAVSNLGAITGATGEDLEFLAEASKQFGATTTLSASQAADAFRIVASAKPDLLGNADALARVTREAITLSEATGVDLASAANTLGNSLNQFSAGAESSGRFINVLAEGSRLGAASVAEVSESLKFSGVAADTAGLSFEETNAIIQKFSTVGIRGSEAGTALRAVLLALEKSTNKELRPSVVGLDKAMENLAKQELDTAGFAKMFGTEHSVAAQVLVKNRAEVSQLASDLTGTSAAYEQAAQRTDNFAGDTKALGSAFEGLQIEIGDMLVETLNLREGTQDLTQGIQDFISAGGGMEDIKQLFQDISDIVVDSVDFIGVYVDQWTKAFDGVGDGLMDLTGSFEEEINLIGDFLGKLFEFYQRTFLSIPSTLRAVFESAFNAIRLVITEAGLLLLGLVEQLQDLPLVGDTVRESMGESIAGIRELLEETAAADQAAIEGAFARAEATREAAFAEVEAKREAREEEREQREEEDEEELERQQEIQERLTEITSEGEKERQKAKGDTKETVIKTDKEEVDSAETKNKITLSDTLGRLEQETSAASSTSETIFKINQAASAAQTLISTPAAIMKAYEQLGPIAGSVAAVGIAAAGLQALNTIRGITLGGGGGGGGGGAGAVAATASGAQENATAAAGDPGTSAGIDASVQVSGTDGATASTLDFQAANTDELGEALVGWLNRSIKSGNVKLGN